MPLKDIRIWKSIYIGSVVIIQIHLTTIFFLNEFYYVRYLNRRVEGPEKIEVAYFLYLIPLIVAIVAAYSAN